MQFFLICIKFRLYIINLQKAIADLFSEVSFIHPERKKNRNGLNFLIILMKKNHKIEKSIS